MNTELMLIVPKTWTPRRRGEEPVVSPLWLMYEVGDRLTMDGLLMFDVTRKDDDGLYGVVVKL